MAASSGLARSAALGAPGHAYSTDRQRSPRPRPSQATKNHPVAFLTLVGKVLPLQVKENGRDPMVPKAVIHEHISG
jgi:hypothetical protein